MWHPNVDGPTVEHNKNGLLSLNKQEQVRYFLYKVIKYDIIVWKDTDI
jgi:hypothetical protein